MAFSLSVVIPNYNGVNLLAQNLPYLYKALESSFVNDFEIIVADDASTDNSVCFLKENFPDIIVVENKENKGFSSNSNLGICRAQKDLVFLMNTDIKLEQGYFFHLFHYFNSSDTFAVMGKVIAWDNDDLQDSAKYPKVDFWSINGTKNYLIKDEVTEKMYSFFASGANLLADRKKLLELGGFNELFSPYYGEDLDLGITAWRAGYKIYFEPKAVCRHLTSSTIKKEPSEKVKIIAKRNKFILHYLHFEGLDLIIYLSKLIAYFCLKCLILDRCFIRAFVLFVGSLKEIKQVKKSLQKHRKKNIRNVVKEIKNSLKEKKIEVF